MDTLRVAEVVTHLAYRSGNKCVDMPTKVEGFPGIGEPLHFRWGFLLCNRLHTMLYTILHTVPLIHGRSELCGSQARAALGSLRDEVLRRVGASRLAGRSPVHALVQLLVAGIGRSAEALRLASPTTLN